MKKPEQLYLVVRAPKAKVTYMRVIFWHTHATSGAAALRKFKELCKDAQPDRDYSAAQAHRVSPGTVFYV